MSAGTTQHQYNSFVNLMRKEEENSEEKYP